MKPMNIILASQSPRRQELMKRITEDFSVCVPDCDESLPAGIAPLCAVRLLAEKKARAALRMWEDGDHTGEYCIIGADTVVDVDGQILGKPTDAYDAEQMLWLLSGRTNTVHTGLAVLSPLGERITAVSTEVDFYPLTEEEISRYIATGEPMDKAGSYGIQGSAALFIKGIRGDYYNAMGFPVSTLYQLMEEMGVRQCGSDR